jgi:hypothetical protein
MELFMPSLVMLLLGVAVAYFLVPKLAPNVLMIVGSVLLAWAVYNHATKFGITEYERATWYYKIAQYSGMIVFGIILLIGYALFFAKSQSAGAPVLSGAPLPALAMPAVGGGFGMIARTVGSRIGELMRKGRITLD